MKENKESDKLSFNEALTIIANTKKSAIDKQHKDIALCKDNVYNVETGEANMPPQPTKRRT